MKNGNKRVYKIISCFVVFLVCVFGFVFLALSSPQKKIKAVEIPSTSYLTNYESYFYDVIETTNTIDFYIYINSYYDAITQNKVWFYSTFLEKTSGGVSSWAKMTVGQVVEVVWQPSLTIVDPILETTYYAYRYSANKNYLVSQREYLIYYLEFDEFMIKSSDSDRQLTIGNYRVCHIPDSLAQDYFIQGYDEGYADGYREGFSRGSETGYDEGYQNGLEIGYEQGINASIDTSWLVNLWRSVDAFFAIRLFNDITFGWLFGVPFAISVIWFIIRQFRGGGGD